MNPADVRLSFACPKTLDDLIPTADPAVRFCVACHQHVFDLSALTEAEARAVMAARDCRGKAACVAFRMTEAEVLVQPGPPRAPRRIALALAAAGLAIPAGAAGHAAEVPSDANVAATGEPAPSKVPMLLGTYAPLPAPGQLVSKPAPAPSRPPEESQVLLGVVLGE